MDNLTLLEGINPKKQQRFILIRTTRNFDMLYIKYGLKITSYNRGVIHHGLATEPECKEFD
jgi:hypothetical protein